MEDEYVASQSVLNSVKDICGIHPTNSDFDRDLIPAINSVLFILYQEGLADKSYRINDELTTWGDILLNGQSPEAISTIIEWVGLRTKLIFDPPTSSSLMDALKQNIDELEWRGFITNNYVGEIRRLYGDQ